MEAQVEGVRGDGSAGSWGMFASLVYAAHRNRTELPAVVDAADLSAVGEVVVGVRRQEPEPVAIAPGHSPAAAAHL
jgi:hypothetical protein